MDDVGLGESGFDIADFAVEFEQDVMDLVVGERDRRSGAAGGAPSAIASSGSKTAGSTSYSTTTSRQPSSAARDRVGEHGHHPLADEAHDVVEHVGVVGIDEVVGVDRGAVRASAGRPPMCRPRCTPGTASAAVLSIDTMRACACGECSTLRWSIPSIAVSIVNSAVPVTTSVAAGAPTLVPTA